MCPSASPSATRTAGGLATTIAVAPSLHAPSKRASCSHEEEPAARLPSAAQVFPLVPGRLSFATFASVEETIADIDRFRERFYFSSNYQERYVPFCLDFGPVNLAVVHKFCGFTRKFWSHEDLEGRELVYYTYDTPAERTNAAFLLAAFMVVDLGYSPEEAWAPFAEMPRGMFATFRDATFCEQTYGLTVLACLKGLRKALSLGWYNPSDFSPEEYLFLESSEAGDMHLVSPKFIAFKGPVDPSAKPTDDVVDEYALPPEHYTRVLRYLDAQCVVRLNEASTYDSKRFTEGGFRHHDIYFDDCTTPGPAAVQAFLQAAEAEEGRVAVHCRAGLGRTGTLIAVYLMEHNGFTAAEAIGWLRVVRPGSVIGGQQHFLHWYEATRGGTASPPQPGAKPGAFLPPAPGPSAPRQSAVELGRAVKQAQIARAGRREAAPPPPSPPDSPAATIKARSVDDFPPACLGPADRGASLVDDPPPVLRRRGVPAVRGARAILRRLVSV